MPCAASRVRRLRVSQLGGGSRLGCGTRPDGADAHEVGPPGARVRRRPTSSRCVVVDRGTTRASQCTRNSTLPSAPRERRRHRRRRRRGPRPRGRRAPRASTARCTSGSRTTPALARLGPGPPRTAASPAARGRRPASCARASAGATVTQRDEREVGDDDVDRAADVGGLEVAHVVRSSTVTRGVVAQRPRELAATDVDRDDVRRAGLEQAVGEAAGRRAGVEGAAGRGRRSRTGRARRRASRRHATRSAAGRR